MQGLLRVLAAVLAIACCAGTASGATSAAEVAARRWLASREHAPGADELAELKGVNPDAYALVKALMMKQSLGLIKRNPNHDFSVPPALSSAPLEPNMLAPVPPTVTAQGAPPPELTLNGADSAVAPEDLPDLGRPTPLGKPGRPTAPPAMPPPPPISSELPPPLPDMDNITQSAQYVSADIAPVLESGPPAPSPADGPVQFSAAATASSVYTGSSGGGGGFGLNWNPDQMINENERMVQNVLGAVAQLTGAHVHRGAVAQKDENKDSEEAPAEIPVRPTPRAVDGDQVEVAWTPPKPRRATRVVPETAPVEPMIATVGTAPAAEAKSPADLYLASTESAPSAPIEHRTEVAQASDDDISSHLPGDVSWSNPYTFTASDNAKGPVVKQENSYLKGMNLGVPQVRLPPKRSPDDENPYLQGLDLAGSPAKAAPTSISASALSAMHQSQLLSSHELLSSFDWGNTHANLQQRKARVSETAKKTQDHLSGFLGSHKEAPKKIPVAHKNAYLAKLGDEAAPQEKPSSVLASHIEQDNPYLQTLDDPPAPSVAEETQQPSLRVAKVPRDRLAAFNWDDKQKPQSAAPKPQESRQLSMTSSKVHQKTAAKKNLHALSRLLGGAPKVPNIKAERLQQAIALKVADAKNPYLKGLDIDSDMPKVHVRQRQENPYMAAFD